MKKNLLIVGSVLLCAVAACVTGTAAVPVSVVKLKNLTPVDTYYTGKTIAIGTDADAIGGADARPGVLAFDISVRIKEILPVGSLVYGPVYDEDGNLVREGTVVASAYKVRQENALKAALLAKQIAEEGFAEAKRNLERSEKLNSKNAISRKDYLNDKTAFLKAELTLDEKANAVELAKWDLESCDLIAPFDGIVTQIWRGENRWSGDGDEVITIQRMDPMMVKLPFPTEIIDIMNKDTKVMVYPQGSDKSVDSWVQIRSIDPKNIYAYVSNKIVAARSLTDEEMKLPKIYKVAPVLPAYHNNPVRALLANRKPSDENIPFAVPQKAIRKDVDGSYYVFVAKDIKEGSNIVEVSKVKVTPGNIVRDYTLGTQQVFKIQSLKNAGDLKESDIIVVVCSNDMKEGKAVYAELGWQFLPDQLVKVAIPQLSQPGLYVPRNAILTQAAGENYVYVNDGGKAKLVSVELAGTCFGNYAISGDGISEGDEVVVIDSRSDLGFLYDGCEIKVDKTLPAPERIEHKRVNDVQIPLDKIESNYYY